MDSYQGTLRHLRRHWPAYFALYAGLIGALLLIGGGALSGWTALIPLGMAAFLLLAYFLGAALWAAHQLHDPGGVRPLAELLALGRIMETERIAFISLGRREEALMIGRRLTGGALTVVDVYNPQLTPAAALGRVRARLPAPPEDDPRFTWVEGSIDLLPLPDESVTAVFLPRILSAFWQAGDRETLLREVYRVLKPNGRVLLAERTRTQTNWLVMGPRALQLPPPGHWAQALSRAGFIVQENDPLRGLIHCLRADKPAPAGARQLQLNLKL